MALPDGWRDGELLALLRLLRRHMTLYIYATDEALAQAVQRDLRGGKSVAAIKEAVRELLDGLSFAMKTRKFTSEAILVDDAYVYPYEHLYETMAAQPENRQGGVWDPDELRTGIRKMEACRHFFDENPERFFTRATIWSKTLPDVRAKFYLWREIYVDGTQLSEDDAVRSDGDRKRLECLGRIFEGVPPAPSPLPPTPSPVASTPGSAMASPTPVRIAVSTGKPAKSRAWTPQDLEAFVHLLAEITVELHTKGTSALLSEIAVRLNRTEASLIGKVQDIRARYDKRLPYHRAAEIPKIIYDETSVAHKIFTADWSDREDPYSMVYFALKDLNNRAISRAKSKLRSGRPPPLKMEMRQRTSSALTSPGGSIAASFTTPKTISTVQHNKTGIHPLAKTSKDPTRTVAHSKPPRVPTAPLAYSEFVRECAAMIKWDEALTYKLCVAIKTALPVYATIPRQVFYQDVAGAMGGTMDAQFVCFRGERILRLCERRYGSLDCFAAAVEGTGESIDVTPSANPAVNDVKQRSPQRGMRVGTPDDQSPTAASSQVPPPQIASHTPSPLHSPSPLPSPSVRTPEPPKSAAKKASQSTGKSSHAAKQILQLKGGSTRTTQTLVDRNASSPSVHQDSPDDDVFDDGGGDRGDGDGDATPHHEQLEGDDEETGGEIERGLEEEDEDDDEVATKSLGSYDVTSDISSDYGHDDHDVVRHQQHERSEHCHHDHDHRRRHNHHVPTSAPGKVHVSSHKTLVVKHLPEPCVCDECGRGVRRRRHADRDTTVTAFHRKRSRNEVYTETGQWIEDHHRHHHAGHEIARRHFHGEPFKARYRDEAPAFRADPREEVMSDHEEAEMDAMWRSLMEPIEMGIAALEAKRREQKERAMDRERQEKETSWRKELRQQVRDEWRATAAATTTTTTTATTAAAARPPGGLPAGW